MAAAEPSTRTLTLPWAPSAPGAARRALGAFVAGQLGDETVANAQLLLSELVTNAYRHAGLRDGDEITLDLSLEGDHLRVDVQDAGRSGIVPRKREPASGGWGLQLLERVASRWGVVMGPPTHVWFELDDTPASALALEEALLALRESQSRFRAMADAAPCLMWMTDAQGAVTFFNRAWLEFTGRGELQELGDGWAEDLHPDDIQAGLRTLLGAIERHEGYEFEYRLRRNDGIYRWMLERAQPVYRGTEFTGLVGAVVDVTDVRETQRLLERERDRAVRLQEITAELSRASTPQEIARAIAGPARALLDGAVGGVYMISADGLSLELLVTDDLSEAVRERFTHVPLDAEIPVVAVFRTREPHFYPGNAELAAEWPGDTGYREALGLEANALLPLISGTHVLGVLTLSFGERRPFWEEERRFLLALAGQCAQALSRARLYDAEKRARREAEAARERWTFIAEAAGVLDQSLAVPVTLSALARLTVPRLADWCGIELADEHGELESVAVVHEDPAKVRFAEELRRRYPSELADGTYRVLRSGLPELYPEITEELLEQSARDDEHLALIRELGMRSAMVVPLKARGRTHGVMTLVASESNRRFDDGDLSLALEVAGRAALAIDTARLYEERSHVAHTLQASLLPAALPDLPGLRLAARYRAAALGLDVGGDFYDIHELASGGTRVVVGDVCGKGAEAAALTALARYTLRATSDRTSDPLAALRELNTAVRRQIADHRFISLACCLLEPDGRLRVACAGHPPPLLLRADGSSEASSARGWLVGIADEAQFEPADTVMTAGDVLVLYTDGVIEADRGVPLDPVELAATLAPLCADGPEAVAAAVEQVASDAAGGELPDDVAILVVQVR